jgi:hypothetical protein
MTYAAQIIDGTVTQVIVGDADWAQSRLGGNWVDTDTLVGAGWTHDETGFKPPQPYPSWVWNDGWEAPTPSPGDDYVWDEETLSWVEAPLEV